jgi:predicted secreted protein
MGFNRIGCAGLIAAGLMLSGCHSMEEPTPAPTPQGGLPAPAVSGVTRNLTVADNGSTVNLQPGQKITISLVGVPTAGYVWGVDSAPPFVRTSDGPSGPTTEAQRQPGFAGGNHWEVTVVEAVSAGEGELVLAQRRPWEPKTEPATATFRVRLKVG